MIEAGFAIDAVDAYVCCVWSGCGPRCPQNVDTRILGTTFKRGADGAAAGARLAVAAQALRRCGALLCDASAWRSNDCTWRWVPSPSTWWRPQGPPSGSSSMAHRRRVTGRPLRVRWAELWSSTQRDGRAQRRRWLTSGGSRIGKSSSPGCLGHVCRGNGRPLKLLEGVPAAHERRDGRSRPRVRVGVLEEKVHERRLVARGEVGTGLRDHHGEGRSRPEQLWTSNIGFLAEVQQSSSEFEPWAPISGANSRSTAAPHDKRQRLQIVPLRATQSTLKRRHLSISCRSCRGTVSRVVTTTAVD